MKVKSKALLVSLVIGALYAIYLIVYFAGAMTNSSDAAETVGAGLATAIITPHLVLIVLAVIFNALGYFQNRSGFALTGGILYCVAAGVFLIYAPFCIIEIIFSFVGYSKVKKINKQEIAS